MNKRFLATGLLVTIVSANINISNVFAENISNNTDKDSIENIKVYRKTSNNQGQDNKKFNIGFHTNEPLGIEITEDTQIDILIEGEGISGFANLNIHDVDNLRGIQKIEVGKKTTVNISEIGELFLDVGNVKYNGNPDDDFDFNVILTLDGKDYKVTPTYDMRENKI